MYRYLLTFAWLVVTIASAEPTWRWQTNPQWNPEGASGEVDTAHQVNGVAPLEQRHTGDQSMSIWTTDLVLPAGVHDVQVGTWYRAPTQGTGAGGFALWLGFNDAQGERLASPWSPLMPPTQQWQWLQVTQEIPAGATVLRVHMVQQNWQGVIQCLPATITYDPVESPATAWEWRAMTAVDQTPSGFVVEGPGHILPSGGRTPDTFALQADNGGSWQLPRLDLSHWGDYELRGFCQRLAGTPEVTVDLRFSDIYGGTSQPPIHTTVTAGGDSWQQFAVPFQASGMTAFATVRLTVNDGSLSLTELDVPLLHKVTRADIAAATSTEDSWRAAWICLPEQFPQGGPADTDTWYRTSLTLPEQPLKQAMLQITADDGFTLQVNGDEVVRGDSWEQVQTVDIAAQLRPGNNVLTAIVHNNGWVTGLLAELDLTLADGSTRVVMTDTSWQVAESATGPWRAAARFGHPPVPPWGRLPYTNFAQDNCYHLRAESVSPLDAGGNVTIQLIGRRDRDVKQPAGRLKLRRGGITYLDVVIDLQPPPTSWSLATDRALAPITIQFPAHLPEGTYDLQFVPRRGNLLDTTDNRIGTLSIPATTETVDFPDTRLETSGGHTVVTIDGNPIDLTQYLLPRVDPYLLGNLADAGIKVVQLDIGNMGWTGPDVYDYTQLDTSLRGALMSVPEARLVLVMDLSTMPQPWWLEQHPAELACDAEGNTTLGMYHGKKGQVPSWASTLYREEVSQALRELVRHLRSQSYADRVIMIKLCNGISYEWFYWGSQDHQYLDYSPPNVAAWRRWLRDHYQDDITSLRSAWGDPAADFATATIPTPDERRTATHGYFRDPVAERHVIDYHLYHDYELGFATLETFARAVKEASDGRLLTAAYNSYSTHIVEGFFAHNASQNNLRRIARSPYIDILYGPSDGYGAERNPGGAGGSMNVTGTFDLWRKLWIQEADNRTFDSLQQLRNGKNLWEDIQIFRREVAFDLAFGCDVEWYDFGRGYQMGDCRISGELGRLAKLKTTLAQGPPPPHQIAVFVDDTSLPFTTQDDTNVAAYMQFLYFLRPAFLRAGVRADFYLLSDLERDDFPTDYPVAFLLNTWVITPHQRQLIDAKLKHSGHWLISQYGVGILDGASGYGSALASAVSGITLSVEDVETSAAIHTTGDTPLATTLLERTGTSLRLSPRVSINDEQAVPLATYAESPELVAAARKTYPDWTAISLATPAISSQFIREIARQAGCHLYTTEGDDAIYIGGATIGMHTRTAGPKTIHLPHASTVIDAFQGNEIGKGLNTIHFDAEAATTYLFHILPEQP